jgi:hypothetical protein
MHFPQLYRLHPLPNDVQGIPDTPYRNLRPFVGRLVNLRRQSHPGRILTQRQRIRACKSPFPPGQALANN